MVGIGGHSPGETPGLIPNPEVKPRHVIPCTEVRESSGKESRCQTHQYILIIFTYTN